MSMTLTGDHDGSMTVTMTDTKIMMGLCDERRLRVHRGVGNIDTRINHSIESSISSDVE